MTTDVMNGFRKVKAIKRVAVEDTLHLEEEGKCQFAHF